MSSKTCHILFMNQYFCLFVYSHLKQFFSCQHYSTSDWAANFDLCLALTRLLNVPHLLWHGTSVYMVSSERPRHPCPTARDSNPQYKDHQIFTPPLLPLCQVRNHIFIKQVYKNFHISNPLKNAKRKRLIFKVQGPLSKNFWVFSFMMNAQLKYLRMGSPEYFQPWEQNSQSLINIVQVENIFSSPHHYLRLRKIFKCRILLRIHCTQSFMTAEPKG
jgi:hypothetical protein